MGRGGGGRFGGGAGADITPIPKERRARTLRRIVKFFEPYWVQVLIVLSAILATSLIGLINPLLLGLLIVFLVRYTKLRTWHAILCILFGFYVASTPLGPYINAAATAVIHLISGIRL